jgi:mono/diheme cytochrome c family protein
MGKLALSVAVSFVILMLITSYGMAAGTPNGAALYKKHCAMCHPSAAKLTGTRIVELMRYPRQGMPTFGNDKISDSGAGAIAEYVRMQIAINTICKK